MHLSLAMEGAFETTLGAPAELASVAQRHLWQRAVPLVLAGLALILIGGLSVWALTRPTPDRVVRLSVGCRLYWWKATSKRASTYGILGYSAIHGDQ